MCPFLYRLTSLVGYGAVVRAAVFWDLWYLWHSTGVVDKLIIFNQHIQYQPLSAVMQEMLQGSLDALLQLQWWCTLLGIVAEWSMVSDLYMTFKFVVYYLIEDEKFSSWWVRNGKCAHGWYEFGQNRRIFFQVSPLGSIISNRMSIYMLLKALTL